MFIIFDFKRIERKGKVIVKVIIVGEWRDKEKIIEKNCQIEQGLKGFFLVIGFKNNLIYILYCMFFMLFFFRVLEFFFMIMFGFFDLIYFKFFVIVIYVFIYYYIGDDIKND